MRYCWLCKEPMYSSKESVCIGNINYDIHVKCKKEYLERNKDGEEKGKFK